MCYGDHTFRALDTGMTRGKRVVMVLLHAIGMNVSVCEFQKCPHQNRTANIKKTFALLLALKKTQEENLSALLWHEIIIGQ